MDRDTSARYVQQLLHTLLEHGGSDLFVSSNSAPLMKVDGQLQDIGDKILSDLTVQTLVRSIMNDIQLRNFEQTMEGNFSISIPAGDRFRVNVFTQRGVPGMVLRHIPNNIPDFESLGLPKNLSELAMAKRGMLIVVGSTGSGKSTTLASMLDYRNRQSRGHIVTIEDPIEFTHENKGCLVTQRELGVDTLDYETALKNTLRQAPDVILIGEIRDKETMDYAIAYAETGHLCLCTLHSQSANQAIDRVLNFFPEQRRHQLLMDLSLNLRAIVSQRLVRKVDDAGRIPAVEILLNTPLMADLIQKGDVPAMKELAAKSTEHGMQTFDQALFNLIESGDISIQEGLRHADSVTDLRLRLKLESRFASGADFTRGTEKLEIEPA